MSLVFLRDPITQDEYAALKAEFPQYTFVEAKGETTLTKEEWGQVEVLFGRSLTQEELSLAHRLRWIHLPTSLLEGLCLKEIQATTNLIITLTEPADNHLPTELAVGALLAFAKNFFYYGRPDGEPKTLGQSNLRDRVCDLRGKTLLEAALGSVGSAIARGAKGLGMRIWGVRDPLSFHPDCERVFTRHELHALMPAVDAICVAAVTGHGSPFYLKRSALELIKKDAILLILGTGFCDEEALFQMLSEGKFRGVLFDGVPKLKELSRLKLPNFLLTPEIAQLPKEKSDLAATLFRYNFHRFTHNDPDAMKNLVQRVITTPGRHREGCGITSL